MSDELASTLASIQEFMAGVNHYETIPPPTVIVPPPMVPTIEDTRLAEQEARVERLESKIRQIRLQDGVEPSRLYTREDMANEFLTQFAFSADIDVSRRELEATRQRPDESISSFVTRWRAKMASMIDRPKEQDQIDMVLWNLQPRFARRLVGIPFQDLKSLVHATFSVEEAIARGLWTDSTPSLDSKGKKPIGSFSRFGEVGAISY
uniref:Retrotransposon gag domain-containing protein n=1 Tax=Vitis vinifera TaxID=29760 RepID=A5C640_VITVI|nr:hypothetical protein VITISV_018224 [Vitis vinifera]